MKITLSTVRGAGRESVSVLVMAPRTCFTGEPRCRRIKNTCACTRVHVCSCVRRTRAQACGFLAIFQGVLWDGKGGGGCSNVPLLMRSAHPGALGNSLGARHALDLPGCPPCPRSQSSGKHKAEGERGW